MFVYNKMNNVNIFAHGAVSVSSVLTILCQTPTHAHNANRPIVFKDQKYLLVINEYILFIFNIYLHSNFIV